jgi:hypothetical protein
MDMHHNMTCINVMKVSCMLKFYTNIGGISSNIKVKYFNLIFIITKEMYITIKEVRQKFSVPKEILLALGLYVYEICLYFIQS